jgi:lysozyme
VVRVTSQGSCDNVLITHHDNRREIDSRYRDATRKHPKDKVRFVIIKATEGETFEDPWFDRHWTSAHAQGFVCGAYYFFRSNRTGKQQSGNIIQHIVKDGQFGKGDLPIAIDVEELKSVTAPASATAFLKEVSAWAKAVEDALALSR